ncbi:histone H2A-Bbd type 2/3-like [Elephas maximus indicus]|uniref:histone H2A-Bbd type 2/3-like n=1 Tax=Elephas maximus indicus TaxID=99487 RepID=UPI002116C83D|nr:histone H2A-Bbd type 2/3-like [Elephas maximus indicus]
MRLKLLLFTGKWRWLHDTRAGTAHGLAGHVEVEQQSGVPPHPHPRPRPRPQAVSAIDSGPSGPRWKEASDVTQATCLTKAAPLTSGGGGGGGGGSSRRQRRTRSRTELIFSASHVAHLLREGHYAQRLSSSAPVFLAAILKCLTAKILELAGNEAQNSGRRLVTPELVDMAVHNNALLSGFFLTTTISQVAPAR